MGAVGWGYFLSSSHSGLCTSTEAGIRGMLLFSFPRGDPGLLSRTPGLQEWANETPLSDRGAEQVTETLVTARWVQNDAGKPVGTARGYPGAGPQDR